jgi:hypothetical protein
MKFYPLINMFALVLHSDNFLYELNIQSKNFKQLYLEIEQNINPLLYNINVYSEGANNIIMSSAVCIILLIKQA